VLGLELGQQLTGQAALLRSDDSPAVMRDQAAQPHVSLMHITQVACAVERVKAGDGENGGVADIVQPARCGDKARLLTEDASQAPRLGGHALSVGPPAWQRVSQQAAG
jgi:hypothetical protein